MQNEGHSDSMSKKTAHYANFVGDLDNRCERLAVGNVFGVAVQGFSISTMVVSTDSLRVCANPLVPW